MGDIEEFVKGQQDLLAKGVQNLALDDNLSYQQLNSYNDQQQQQQQYQQPQINNITTYQQETQQLDQSLQDAKPPQISRKLGKASRGKAHHAFHDLQSPVPNQYVDHQVDPNAAASTIGLFPPQFGAASSNLNLANNNVNSHVASPIQSGQFTPATVQRHQFTPVQEQQQFGFNTISPNLNNFTVNNNINTTNNSHNISQATVSEELSVPTIRNEMNEYYKDKPFLSFEHVSAPVAGTEFRAIDQANSIPQYARMTMYSVPESEDLRAKTKIPLALVLRPFAECVPESEIPMEVPQIKIEETQTVPRCRRCRAYLNPAMQHDVRNMTCNICGFVSPIPPEYASTIDIQGVRDDYHTRSELHTGVVDYIVPKDYNLDPEIDNNALHRVFLIDMSYNSYKSKLVETACSAIRMALYGDGGESQLPAGTKVAIVGYDSNIHFFDLSPELEQSCVSVVTDIDDPFIPFEDGVFADPMESYNIIEQTLTTIEQNTRALTPEPTLGAALKVAGMALKGVSGGQIITLLSTLPSYGPGTLQQRVRGAKSEVDFVKEVCTADNKFYHELAADFVKNNIGVDILVASTSNVDLINVGTLATNTGGSVKEWLPFNVERDDISLTFELKKLLNRTIGYQCQLKIRCSHGLQVNNYYGPFATTSGVGAPNIPIVTGDTSIVADFKYDSKLDTKKDAHFQAALLYTSNSGVRKVRVVNSILSITQRINDVFDFADQDAILKALIKTSVEKLSNAPIVALRSSLMVKCSDIMAAYKHYVASDNGLPTQLILPQSLRTMPMFILSLLKSKAFKERINFPDHRVSSVFKLSQSDTTALSAYLYPLLFCIHSLEENDFMFNEETGMINVAKSLPLSVTNLEYGGAYLLFTGERITIWLHSDVNPLLLQDLFGQEVDSIDKVQPFIATLPFVDTHISQQVRNMCAYFAKHFNGVEKQSVEICRFRMDPNEIEFQQSFVEDKNDELLWSYAEFLKEMRKQIASKGNNLATPVSPKKENDGENISRKFGIF